MDTQFLRLWIDDMYVEGILKIGKKNFCWECQDQMLRVDSCNCKEAKKRSLRF